jgi:hypothetical protein
MEVLPPLVFFGGQVCISAQRGVRKINAWTSSVRELCTSGIQNHRSTPTSPGTDIHRSRTSTWVPPMIIYEFMNLRIDPIHHARWRKAVPEGPDDFESPQVVDAAVAVKTLVR